MNEEGEGMIYDQFDLADKGLRYTKMPPLLVDLSQPYLLESNCRPSFQKKIKADALYFCGDLTHLHLTDEKHHYLQEALQKEKELLLKYQPTLWRRVLDWTRTLIVKPYQAFFRYLLELTD